MKDFLRNLKIGTKISILVVLTLLLMCLVIWFGLRQINVIGKEVTEIVETNIPLMEMLSTIAVHNLVQTLHFEQAIRLAKLMAQETAAKDSFKRERESFLEHGRTIAQEIGEGEEFMERLYERYKTHEIGDTILKIDYQLRSVHKKYTDHQFLAGRVFNLLSQGKLKIAEATIQKIVKKREEEEVSRIQENLLLEIENFTQDSIVRAKKREQAAKIGMLSISALVLLFSLGLGIFVSQSISRPLSLAVNVANQIAGGERRPKIQVPFKDEVGLLLMALKDMCEALSEAEGAVRKRTHDLGERVKELNCLYSISHLVEKPDISLEEILQGVVDLIPPAWQYPEITCARIILEGQIFRTNNFEETIWKQSCDIIVRGKRMGTLEVCYLEEKPESDEGPFVKEERSVINAIAKRLGEIIEYKRVETEAKELRRQIEFILGATKTGLDIIDSEFNIRYIDEEWGKVYGDPTGKKCYEYFMGRSEVCPGCGIPKALETKTVTVTEEVLVKENNRPIQVTTLPFQDENGEWLVAEVNVDITERKQAEEQIKTSLEEKEVLLREIHHRVKNNMQVISSLLSLQARYIKDKRTVKAFKDSRNRIRAMALIHERLYQSEGLAKIDFGEYIQHLASNLFHSYGVNSEAITLKVNTDGVSLDIDTAIPCGLIINELVSNSLKHAFPRDRQGPPTPKGPSQRADRRAGEIRIDLRSDNSKFTLIVSDNGVGFPKDLDFRNTESLGLQLVNSLTGQINGTMELDTTGGTAFKITFSP